MNLTPENTMERILNGEDVTPSCRAEYFVKQAIDNAGSGGGGGDEYETVAEIAVGTMQSGGEEMPGLYIYSDSEAVAPALNENETYYLNAADNESNSVVIDLDTKTLRFNASTGEGLPTPLDPDKSMYVIQWAGNGLFLAADTNAIENTSVKILKKVSGGETITVDSELSETSKHPVQNKVIAAALEAAKPLIVTGTLNAETMEISEASASLAQVLAAAASGRQIEFQLRATAEKEGVTVRAYDTFADSSITDNGNGTGTAVFSAVSLDDGTPTLCRIVAASGDHDGQWIYDETPLATVTP